MRNRRAFILVALLVFVIAVLGRLATTHRAAARPPMAKAEKKQLWAQVATRACETMQKQISLYARDHWKPINRPGPGLRVAALRRELLVIHEAGLREIRSEVGSPTRAQAHAVALYENMLMAIRAVIRTAAGGDPAAYWTADIRMVRTIQATRAAFIREGAGRVCDFAI